MFCIDHGRGASPASPVVRLAPLTTSPHNNMTTAAATSNASGGGEKSTASMNAYPNLPDIMSPNSPLLSTIHEDTDIPRSIMIDSGMYMFVIVEAGTR